MRIVLMLLCPILLLIMQLRTHYTKYWTSEKGHWILTNSPVTLNITPALSPFPTSLGIFNLQSEAEKFNSTDGGNIRLWSASAKAPSSPHSHDSLLFAGLKPSQQDSGCLAPAPVAHTSSGSDVMITQWLRPGTPALRHQGQILSRTLLLHLLYSNNTITTSTWS